MRTRPSDQELEKTHSQWTPVTRRRFLFAATALIGLLTFAACGVSDDAPAPSSTPTPSPAPVPVPPPAGPISGLDFPGSAAVATTMRFRFLNPLPIYPATY